MHYLKSKVGNLEYVGAIALPNSSARIERMFFELGHEHASSRP